VIDLDSETLECYEGFNKGPVPKGERFYSEEPNEGGYYPVRLTKAFHFSELPTNKEFLAALEPEDVEGQ
jgi:hypothetical protein